MQQPISGNPIITTTTTTTTIPSTHTFACISNVKGLDDDDDVDSNYSFRVYILNSLADHSRHYQDPHALYYSGQDIDFKHSLFVPPVVGTRPSQYAWDCIPTRKAVVIRAQALANVLTVKPLYDEMSATADEAPGSPPGLTASKSSKASTNPSSSSHSAEGILSDVTHFEDIALGEELRNASRLKPQNGGGMERQSTPRGLTSATTMSSSTTITTTKTSSVPMRDLTNQHMRPVHPPRSPPLNRHDTQPSLTLPNGMHPRKFARAASTPSLAIQAMSNYNRSRSPSPQSSPPMLKHPSQLKAAGTWKPTAAAQPGLTVRRGSWQPSRKSIKELEAECDDEGDDDLPEDTSLWNVPLSPRPAAERSMPLSPLPSPRASPRASPGGSPERSSPLRTSIGADGVQYTAPKSAPIPSTRKTLPANFQSPSTSPNLSNRSSTTPAGPTPYQNQRSKSWNMLSEEAKALTQSLESHAFERETALDGNAQFGEFHAPGSLTRVKTAPSAQLPPLRTNNIMIDPLPISKEKEAVLSRTRPSWLPPKSKTEEKKHLKEYQRMMRLSQEAEKKRAEKTADTQCAKDDAKSTLLRLWEQHVIPNWDQVIRDPQTREIWWRGVSPKSRGHVWSKALGNDLALTETSFKKALERAERVESDLKANPRHSDRERSWFDAIRRDVHVTFPALKIFQPGAPLHDSLVQVLKAYSMYRSDVGYSHGTHLIAAFLLLAMGSASQTFISLANLMNRPLPLAFLTGDPAGEQKAYHLTLGLLRKKYPRLHDHLFAPLTSPETNEAAKTNGNTPSTGPGLHFQPSEIMEPMLRSLFLGPGPGLGIDVAARVWDVMVFDGDSAVIRAAVATLGQLEGKLYGSREDVLAVLGWKGQLGDVGEEDAFMAVVRVVGKEHKVPVKGKK